MNFRKSRALITVLLLLIISGCVANAERMTDISATRLTTDKNVGVVWISPCSKSVACRSSGEASNLPEFVPNGSNGLLVYAAIMSAHKDLSLALDELPADRTVTDHYLQPTTEALTAAGFNVSTRDDYIYFGDLEKLSKHKVMRLKNELKDLHPEHSGSYFAFGFEYNMDLSAIAANMGSDVLVVLEVQDFGMRRDFGPLGVPTSYPYAASLVRAYIWDVASKEFLYSDFGIAEERLGEQWNQPNDWRKTLIATEKALALAIDRVTEPLVAALRAIN